ncbi:MAG: hypothetical protein WCP79_12310 [Bacillota bacterium]
MIRSILDSAKGTDSYKLKLVDAYTFFSEHGFIFSYHALHQVVGWVIGKRIEDYDTILKALKEGVKYRQTNGRIARLGFGIAVTIGDTGEIITVVPAKKPKEGWVLLHENAY